MRINSRWLQYAAYCTKSIESLHMAQIMQTHQGNAGHSPETFSTMSNPNKPSLTDFAAQEDFMQDEHTQQNEESIQQQRLLIKCQGKNLPIYPREKPHLENGNPHLENGNGVTNFHVNNMHNKLKSPPQNVIWGNRFQDGLPNDCEGSFLKPMVSDDMDSYHKNRPVQVRLQSIY
jgi:hypothetical protein